MTVSKGKGLPEASDPGLSPETIIFLPVETNIHSCLPAWAMPIYFFTSSGEHIFDAENGGHFMKGYLTATGYMGYVDGRYVLFSSESDYREYVDEKKKKNRSALR